MHTYIKTYNKFLRRYYNDTDEFHTLFHGQAGHKRDTKMVKSSYLSQIIQPYGVTV